MPARHLQLLSSFLRATRRAWATALTKPLPTLAVVAVAGLAAAAVTVTYTSPSTLQTTVTPAPVQFEAGDDAGPNALSDYVTAYSISTNQTYVTTTVKGVPEATLQVDSFFKLHNVDDVNHTITLSTSQVANAYVTDYTIKLYDTTDTLVATLDLGAASPSASTVIPAATTYRAEMTLTLASGAGSDNVDLTNALALAVA